MDEFTESPLPGLLPTDKLSERQKQCLELVALGHTSKEIGRILNLSPSTVDNHINIALERLGVDNRTAAAKLFVYGNQIDMERTISKMTTATQQAGRHLDAAPNQSATTSNKGMLPALFTIPPLGGRLNLMSQRRRFYHVAQIILLALMVFSAATITIAGIVHLFTK